MDMPQLARALALAFAAAMPLASTAADAPVPVAAFFEPLDLSGAQLSPSGRWLAAIGAKAGERKKLIMLDTQNPSAPQIIALFDTVDVIDVEWMTDDTLVFETQDIEDADSLRKQPSMFSIRRDGKEQRLLIRRERDRDFSARGAKPLEPNFGLLSYGAEGSGEIIVGEYKYTSIDHGYVTPYYYNVTTRAKRLVMTDSPPHKEVGRWWFDPQGRPRLASATEAGKVIYYYRAAQGGDWHEIGRFPFLNQEFTPAFFDGEDRFFVYKLDSQGNYTQLHQFDFATGAPKAEPQFTTPGYDTRVTRLKDRGVDKTVGYRVRLDDSETLWINPAMKAFQQQVDKLLPGRVNLLSCRGCDTTETVLVLSYSDRHPGEYLIYSGKTKSWQRLGNLKAGIDERRMGQTDLLRIKARDGLEFPIWVTRPAGSKPDTALPTVVLVHGGPWARGRSWGFKDDAQFLASRGYLVIEPEFRGSSGFGDKLMRAGYKQWGMAMQDDLADALKFAVSKGWADPKRACIAGASYGGYAALMGVAKQGDLFRCAVSWVGVTDPRLMFDVHWSDIDRDSKKYSMPETIGDPVADEKMLAANAPIMLARQIKAPVLLAYGYHDRRVPIVHGEKMRDALIAAGNKPEWIVYEDEGHGWARPKNSVDFWTKVETFLDKNLKQ
ncbi:alpha/beta hydrolase family protein [Roseateles microcysteis]|uniref:alpha/beta hydrolase family protein n=1 Tax=Roseateles microcysteis TaxID=3119057 RepID=UPI002FE5AF1E